MCDKCTDKIDRRFHCVGCDAWTITYAGISEYYMVRDLWWRIAGAGKGMLCIGCLEARLGFTLCRSDFIDAPINMDRKPRSERLTQRLTRTLQGERIWQRSASAAARVPSLTHALTESQYDDDDYVWRAARGGRRSKCAANSWWTK
jgi:hypothetical protein